MMKNKFYRLETINDTNIVGACPQIESFLGQYDEYDSNSIYNVRWNILPQFKLDLNEFKIQEGAIITDFMSTFLGENFHLVSNKIITTLNSFNIPRHKFIPVEFKNNENKILRNYNMIFFESNAIEVLDLKKCVFIKEQDFFSVSTIEELRLINRECLINGIYIENKTIVLKSEINNVDLFNLDFLSGIHLSEKLGDALLAQDITGLNLIPVYYEITPDSPNIK